MEKIKKITLTDLDMTYPNAMTYLKARKGAIGIGLYTDHVRVLGSQKPVPGTYTFADLELLEKALCLG